MFQCSFLWLLAIVSVQPAPAPDHLAQNRSTSAAPVELRIGIVAIDDFTRESQQWTEVFSQLAGQHPHLEPKLALGTYGDLLHWMKNEMIDLAVLTPGVFAEGATAVGPESEPVPFDYVATIGIPPAKSPWAEADRRREGAHYVYRSVCLVPQHSPLQNSEDLHRAARLGQVQFVFVHPLSVSGRLIPEVVLREMGVRPRRQQILFSHSHSGSLRLLAESDADARSAEAVHRVAFVWDDAGGGLPHFRENLRQIELPLLTERLIPHDLVAVRRGFAQADLIRDWFLSHQSAAGEFDFRALDDWAARYEVIASYSRALGIAASQQEVQQVALEEVGQILLHHARSQPQPPRLAVVLPGGGAKCSYQVGALVALEERLAALRQQEDVQLDIDLVVGTSGGAINSIPVALGVSASNAGREDFQEVWKKLDQTQIVLPARLVRWNVGLWLALMQFILAMVVVRLLASAGPRRAWTTSALLTTLGTLEISIGATVSSPWHLLGSNHFLHHAWLWLSFGLWPAAWCLLISGLVGLAAQSWLQWRGGWLQLPKRLPGWGLAILLVGLPLVQLATLLFFQRTLSGGEGMEAALAQHMIPLVDRHLLRGREKPLRLDKQLPDNERLLLASRQLIERKLLQRDLVITGNCLAQSEPLLPSDLYFYAQASGHTDQPPFGPRGISLHEQPSLLFDVVLGSGSIFPVFPARRLTDFPAPKQWVELIDGGFAHNSPIEAAVLWGATHIILIEATPQQRRPRTNFAENAAAAFAHLHKQTQLVDARSKRQVVAFTLAPDPPHLCVLDFASNLVEGSIARGYRDARGRVEWPDGRVSHVPKFRKELGEPIFTGITADAHSQREGF